MRKLLQAASFAVLLTAAPAAAEAAQTVVTVTGKIVTVHNDNYFGLTVGQNQNIPISLTFSYDPSLGTYTGGLGNQALNGLGTVQSPLRSVTVKVGGLSDTWSIVPEGSSYQTGVSLRQTVSYGEFGFGWAGFYYLNPDIGSSAGVDSTQLSGHVTSPANAPTDFSQPFVGPLNGGVANLTRQGYGVVYSYALDFTGGSAVGGVPEPGAWALMIGGFGLAGAALRRRRTSAAA